MSDRTLYTSTSRTAMGMFLMEIGLTTGMTVVDGPGEVVTDDDASRTSALGDAARQIVQLVGGPMVWRSMLIGWSRTVDGERSEETTAVGGRGDCGGDRDERRSLRDKHRSGDGRND